MPDYFGALCLSKLPFCREKQEIINGVEKTCLVIPCDEAQLQKWAGGNWWVSLKVTEIPINPKLKSHIIRLGFRNYNEVHKALSTGSYNRLGQLGYLMLNIKNASFKNDYTNNMTEIRCTGRIFLDSIQSEDIKTDYSTGRKYVDFEFRKTQLLDRSGNSHEAVVKTRFGEHQIALAKEIRDDVVISAETEQPKTTETTYEGYKF